MRDLYFGYQIGQAVTQAITTNNRLAQLISGQNAQQLEADRHSQRLDNLLYLRKRLQSAQQQQDANPVRAFWQATEFGEWSRLGSISVSSFHESRDKEAFHECSEMSEQIRQCASAKLGLERVQTLERTRKAMAISPVLRSYLVWNNIHRKMGSSFISPSFLVWWGKPRWRGIVASFVIALAIAIPLDSILRSVKASDAALASLNLLILGAIVWSSLVYTKRNRLAEKLNVLAQSVGGQIQPTTRISDVREIPRSFRTVLEQYGVPIGRMSESDLLRAYEQDADLIHSSNATFELGINESNYPKTISLLQ